MSRKSALAILFVLFALFAAFTINKPQFALAQTPKPKPAPILGKTFLEGMALDEENEPLYKQIPISIIIKNCEGEDVYVNRFQGDLGGLYRIELKPGIYDIFVDNTRPDLVKLRPLRINGVMVKGGEINKIDITMHKGEALEVIGEPVEPTLSAIIISQKLEEMQKQIDDLKKQVEELKKK